MAVYIDTFEGALPAFWDGSTVAAGATLDRTAPPPGGVTGWGTRALHAAVIADSDQSFLQSGGLTGGPAQWLHFDFCVANHAIPSGTDLFVYFGFYDTGLGWDPATALAIYNDAGTLHLNAMAYYGGSEHYGLLALPAIVVGTQYRVDILYDATGGNYELWLDGVSVVSQAMAPAVKPSLDHHQFGIVANSHAGDEIYFNDFAFGYVVGVGSGSLEALTSAASGVHSITGSSAETLAALTGSGAGAHSIGGLSAETLAALTSAGVGSFGFDGSSAETLASVVSAASGNFADEFVLGFAGESLAALTCVGAGARGVGASGAVVLAALVGEGAGVRGVTGAGAAVLGSLSSAAIGRLRVAGTGAAVLPDLVAYGYGSAYAARRVRTVRLGAAQRRTISLNATVRQQTGVS